MKKTKKITTVLFAVAIGFGIYSFETNEDAPQKVIEAFAKKFPATKKVKWEKESNTEWEGEFQINGMECSANFLVDGTWLETEQEIKKKSIPANIKTALIIHFLDYKIKEAELLKTSDGSFYEFKLIKNKEELEVVVDIDGIILNKKIKSRDKEDRY